MQLIKISLLLSMIACCSSCTHRVEVETKPIVVEININVKIDRELDNFFGDIDESLTDHK